MATKEELAVTNSDLEEQLAAERARAEAAELALKQAENNRHAQVTHTGVRKAGANWREKNMVVKHHLAGRSVENIGLRMSLRDDHVRAIIKQYEAGTLKLNPRSLSTSDGSYGVKQEE